jgi:hypothetical protein
MEMAAKSAMRSICACVIFAALILTAQAEGQSSPAPVEQLKAALASNEHLRNGIQTYEAGDFKKAIPDLRQALTDLKTESGFEASHAWRVLVDDLGMAYGITGDLKNAKATFDYGVSKDPDYPLFHYNLACTFAEMNDRDHTIAELKEAFRLKDHRIPGEQMPNPGTDDSFVRFMKDKSFLSALDEIRKAGQKFPGRLDFTSSAAPWIFTIAAADFDIAESKQSPDGKQSYFLFRDEKTGVIASIYIEPAVKCADSASCRNFVRTANLSQVTGAENVASSEIDMVSVFEYLLPKVKDLTVRQYNMYAEFVRDGLWVDLHISKLQYKPEDHKLFEALVRSVKFENK